MEWNLVFRTEDHEAKERLRWIWASLQADPHVGFVEEYGIGSPNCTHLRVEFVEGQDQPQSPPLRHMNRLYGVEMYQDAALSSLDMLLSDELDQV